MYRTANGEEIFVIDGHTHFWDGSPANQKNIHGKRRNQQTPPRLLWKGLWRKLLRYRPVEQDRSQQQRKLVQRPMRIEAERE